MRRRTVLITLSLLFIIAIPFVTKANDDKGPGSVRKIPDLSYLDKNSRDSTDESQLLDLYIPTKPTAGSLPLIVFIHGGAWLQGDKSEAKDLAMLLAHEGFATASINYRLSQQAPFPAQIEDCKNAIRYLRAHANEYGFDGNKIGVWGVSAGGHLAALLGTLSTSDPPALLPNDSAVQAVCDWCGPSDLISVATQAGSRTKIDYDSPSGPVAKLLGGLVTDKKELAMEASPITYVTKDDPPIMIVHGDIDDLVPFAQSEEFAAKLKAAGVPSKLVTVKGAGHNLGSETELKRLTDFFRQVLIEGKRDFQIDN